MARRCFLAQGANVSAATIARELGVTHTTVLSRFRSKEALMIAALGPPERVPWTKALESGPDDRPLRDQLVELGRDLSAYFEQLVAGLAVLHAAGIKPERIRRGRKEPPPVQAFNALSAWLQRARDAGRIGPCDVEVLTATILGSMHSWAMTARVCGRDMRPGGAADFVERFVGLLWAGISPPADPSVAGRRTTRTSR